MLPNHTKRKKTNSQAKMGIANTHQEWGTEEEQQTTKQTLHERENNKTNNKTRSKTTETSKEHQSNAILQCVETIHTEK